MFSPKISTTNPIPKISSAIFAHLQKELFPPGRDPHFVKHLKVAPGFGFHSKHGGGCRRNESKTSPSISSFSGLHPLMSKLKVAMKKPFHVFGCARIPQVCIICDTLTLYRIGKWRNLSHQNSPWLRSFSKILQCTYTWFLKSMCCFVPIFKHTMFWFVKCLKSQTWLKYIVQPSCLLYPESRYVYICVPVSGAFVSRYLYPSWRCREPSPREWDHYHKFPRQLHLSSHYPAHLPMSHHHQSPKKHFFLGSRLQKRWFRNVLSLLEGNQVGILWQKKWAPGQNSVCGPNVEQCRGLPEIRLVPYFPIRGQLWAVRAWPKNSSLLKTLVSRLTS